MPTHHPSFLITLLALPLAIACNGQSTEPTDTAMPPTPTGDTAVAEVSVTIVPTTATVVVDETFDFDAQVTGTSDLAVTWSVEGTGDLGSIDSDGVYTAPSTVPDPDQVTVRATSVADATAYAEATVTIAPPEDVPVEPWVLFAGGTGVERGYDAYPLEGGGYILSGASGTQGMGNMDGWMLEVDASGNIVWQVLSGELENQNLYEVVPLAGGGFMAAGVYSTPTDGYGKLWLVRVDASGNIVDERTLGGGDQWHYRPHDMLTRSNGEIVIVGVAEGGTYPNQIHAAFAMRLDAAGDLIETHSYSQAGSMEARGVAERPGGGLAIAGDTYSSGSSNQRDAMLLLLDSDMNVELARSYGSTGIDEGHAVGLTPDGGYLLAAKTWSFDSDSQDAWMLKLDSAGVVQWQNRYGSSGYEGFEDLVMLDDGSVVAVGEAGNSDVGWLAHIGGDGTLLSQQGIAGARYSIETDPAGGFITAGYRGGDYQLFLLRLDASFDVPDCGWLTPSNAGATPTDAVGQDVVMTAPVLEGEWSTPASTVTASTLPSELDCND